MLTWRRRWRWRDVLIDVAPAVALLCLGEIDVAAELSGPFGSAHAGTAVIPVFVACAALVFRRRLALGVLAVVLLALVVPPLVTPTRLTYWGEYVPWLVALYSVSRHGRPRAALIGAAMSVAALVILPALFPDMRDAADPIYNSVVLAGAWLLGRFARSWTAYRDRTLRLEFERGQAEERATREERARIARELHDVIAHTITVIVMQAGGARLAYDNDPSAAHRALGEIEALGRGSLAELRVLLAVLRSDTGEEGATTPQPTLADVAELCSRMRELGLRVTLDVRGDTVDLPLGLQLTAYRVLQEGLINVVKHSGTVATHVRIDRAASGGLLIVEVASQAPAEPARIPSAQYGLIGLEERVRAAGGAISAGPQRDGGFLLRAELPVDGAAVSRATTTEPS